MTSYKRWIFGITEEKEHYTLFSPDLTLKAKFIILLIDRNHVCYSTESRKLKQTCKIYNGVFSMEKQSC